MSVSVSERTADVVVTAGQVRGLVFPTTVQVAFGDGSAERVAVAGEGRAVTLDPDGLLPDVDRENDAATPDA